MQFPGNIYRRKLTGGGFFGCLEDLDDSPPTPAAAPEATSPFSRSFFGAVEDDGNELLPFTLLVDMGNEVESRPT
jgi:hypothetical protein